MLHKTQFKVDQKPHYKCSRSMGDLSSFWYTLSVSFFSSLMFFIIQVFHVLGYTYDKTFWCDIMKGVVSLISSYACLSFEQRKVSDFYELILYSVMLSKWLSVVELRGSLIYTVIKFVNTDTLTFDFLFVSLRSSSVVLLL